jgi:hypothetical protein
MTYKPHSLDDIIHKAKKYNLDNSDIGMIGACWGDKFGEYYEKHPGIYKQPRNQRLEEAREYANKETMNYMRTILTARGLP